MDTSAGSATLSDDSNATQADSSGVDSPIPTSKYPYWGVKVRGQERSGTIVVWPIWDATIALPPPMSEPSHT